MDRPYFTFLSEVVSDIPRKAGAVAQMASQATLNAIRMTGK